MLAAALTLLAANLPRLHANGEERGNYLLHQYTMRDYQAHNRIWNAVQDERGFLYFGNRGYVLRFDGENWRLITIPGGGFIRSIDRGPDGRIWVGGTGELGYLEPGGPEGMTWTSLLAALPPLDHALGQVQAVYVTAQGVFFATDLDVIRWRDGRIKVWSRSGEAPIRLLRLSGSPWLVEHGAGLSRLNGDEWQRVSDDPLFRNGEIRGAADEPDGTWLIVTKDGKLYRVRDLVVRRVPTVADEILAATSVQGITRLPDGALAFGTSSRGTILLAADGSLEAIFDQDAGLLSQNHRAPFIDRDGGLWLMTNNAPAHVERGAYTIFDRRRGLPPSYIHHVVRHNGRIIVGTDNGLYALEQRDVAHGGARLRKIGTTPVDTIGMCDHPEGVLFSSPDEVLQLQADDTISPAFSTGRTVVMLYPSPLDPDVVFVGMSGGTGVARRIGGRWKFLGSIPGTQDAPWDMVQDADGTLWVENNIGFGGVARVRFAVGSNYDPAQATVTQLDSRQGLPAGSRWTAPRITRSGQVFFCTVFGMFRFDDSTNRFVPFTGYGKYLAGASVLVDRVVEDSEGTAWASVSMSDESESPWGRGTFGRALLEPDGGRKWELLPTRLFAPTHMLAAVTVDEFQGRRVIWVGTQDGLVRIDVKKLKRQQTMPRAYVSGVTTTSGTAVFGGGTPDRGSRPSIDYVDRNLEFDYGAPSFPPGRSILYETRLEGFDSDWTPPTREGTRVVNNLFEGEYRFLVRTVDVDGRTGGTDAYTLRIRPPWFRSMAAYGGYGLVAALGVLVLIRWRVASLRRRNEQLEITIAERTVELKTARDDADRANRAKSVFLANMSHELRTPLNGILGYTQILRRDPAMNTQNRQRLGVLESSGEHLLRLINEVLDLSKIEAGRLELHPVATDVGVLAQAVAATLRPRFEEKQVGFALTLDPGLPACVLLDEQKVGQVLFNLLGNAVKFTKEGRVELRLSNSANAQGQAQLRFEVTDTGVGIPPEQQARIFEPFSQVDDSTRRGEGTGLGLAICARIVELMDGRLQVESEPGRGSRFWFEIPANEIEGMAPAGAARAAEPEITGYEGPRKRVLVVDDVPVNRDVVVEMLEPLGFEVVTAPDGGAAIDAIRAQKPDLVLMDLRMSPVSGVDAVKRIRGDESMRGLRIVAFSASTIGFTRAQALEIGCDDLLSKPFREEELFALLERQLRVQWKRSEAAAKEAGVIGAKPSPAQAEAVLDAARRGDAPAVREELKKLATDDASLRDWAGEMDQLAAQFRMQEIRRRLETLPK